MRPRKTAGMATLGVALAVIVIEAGCGKKSPAPGNVTSQTPDPTRPGRFLDPGDITGHWQWSHIDDEDDVRFVRCAGNCEQSEEKHGC